MDVDLKSLPDDVRVPQDVVASPVDTVKNRNETWTIVIRTILL